MLADFHFHDKALERMVAEILAYPDQKAGGHLQDALREGHA